MKLSAYLSPSRHGVYYFRWPLPIVEGDRRRTLKVSLRTKCPDRAGDLARYMASCGILIRDNRDLAKYKRSEVRVLVRAYFKAQLDQYLRWIDSRGLSHNALEDVREEMLDHQSFLDAEMESNAYLPIKRFVRKSGLSEQDWNDSLPIAQQELRKGRRELLRAVLEANDSLDVYDLGVGVKNAPVQPQEASTPLGVAVENFMVEHAAQWSDQMAGKARGFLAVLLEYFGEDRLMGSVSRHDASELKKVAQALPVNRNTKPETRDLPLMQAIEVVGVKKVSVETVNNHMAMFFRFWDWAERHGHAPHKLFEGMKVTKSKRPKVVRKAYTKDQTATLFAELTENHSGLVKKDDHKWGALLGMFTGARLNEIAQLEVSDIASEDGTWFVNITDEGNNKKRVKANASRRKVPLHSELIRLGFLDWVSASAKQPRLFMSFSFDQKDGYGRNLGRWFNGTFLVGLNMKESGLVFHSLRYTMVERLAQADVPEPLYQDIVGHERQGVTQQVYNKSGHTLAQKLTAIEKFGT